MKVAGVAVVLLLGCSADLGPPAETKPVATVAQALDNGGFFRSFTILSSPEAAVRRLGESTLVEAQTESVLPACEPDSSGLTRAACPPEPPAAVPCDPEGLECRYLAMDGSELTAELYECVHGLWSFVKQETSGEPPAPVDTSPNASSPTDPQCPVASPLPDDTCDAESIHCGYGPCDIGGRASLEFTCECGRWRMATRGCPRD
jgi:hypothetical protein